MKLKLPVFSTCPGYYISQEKECLSPSSKNSLLKSGIPGGEEKPEVGGSHGYSLCAFLKVCYA
jgi:hypothetical protein